MTSLQLWSNSIWLSRESACLIKQRSNWIVIWIQSWTSKIGKLWSMNREESVADSIRMIIFRNSMFKTFCALRLIPHSGQERRSTTFKVQNSAIKTQNTLERKHMNTERAQLQIYCFDFVQIDQHWNIQKEHNGNTINMLIIAARMIMSQLPRAMKMMNKLQDTENSRTQTHEVFSRPNQWEGATANMLFSSWLDWSTLTRTKRTQSNWNENVEHSRTYMNSLLQVICDLLKNAELQSTIASRSFQVDSQSDISSAFMQSDTSKNSMLCRIARKITNHWKSKQCRQYEFYAMNDRVRIHNRLNAFFRFHISRTIQFFVALSQQFEISVWSCKTCTRQFFFSFTW